MPKRFTATEKWLDPWFSDLPLTDKMFWVFLLDNCDHAGFWQVNWRLVKFHICEDFIFNENEFSGRIEKISEQKWFIPKFIKFQYGVLNPANRVHKSAINILKKEGASKVLARSMLGAKDKDKELDKAQDKEKEKAKDKVKAKDKAFVVGGAR